MNLNADTRILVTGASGFLGRHVTRVLKSRGYRQIVTPRSREYDLRDQTAVKRLLETTAPDILVHLAAVVGGIGANQQSPGRFFYENAVMGIHLLEYARQVATEKVVALGTICSYPKFTPVPFREEDLWNGYPEETNAPYGLAKKMLLVQAQAYRQEYGMNIITLLPVNLYGSEDNFDPQTSHVIPALIRKCVEAKQREEREIVCWGDGTPTREFLYVEDAAEAIVLAMERYDSGEPVNIGAGREISIRALVEMIATMTGYEGNIVWDTTRPNGQPRRCVDTSRARDAFGFQATTALETGLKKTIDWYRQNQRL
jgi:GDP-L-fucose synthase